MRKFTIVLLAVVFCLTASAQKKDTTTVKDSSVVITFASKQEYFNVLQFIASKIDSKKETEEVVKYFEDRKKLMPVKK